MRAGGAIVAIIEATSDTLAGNDGVWYWSDYIPVKKGKAYWLTVDAKGPGPIMLWLHGFAGDLNNWLFNHEVLASDRIVYALDLPGHGGSSRLSGSPDLLPLDPSLIRVLRTS